MRQPGALAQGSGDGRRAVCVCWSLGPAGQGGDGAFNPALVLLRGLSQVGVLGVLCVCHLEFPEKAGIHCLCLAGEWS